MKKQNLEGNKIVFSSSKTKLYLGEEWEINLPDGLDINMIEISHDRDTGVNLAHLSFEAEEDTEKRIVIKNDNGKVLIDENGIYVDGIKIKKDEVKEAWDKIKELPFEDFQQQALHRLQRQFLNTPDTKDTVLTRMNIIQMIKDLKELGLK